MAAISCLLKAKRIGRTEPPIAFVKPKKDVELNAEEIMEHCKNIASYKRPQHVELWPVDKDFPITRSTKVDKLELKKDADIIIEKLREAGKWDAS